MAKHIVSISVHVTVEAKSPEEAVALVWGNAKSKAYIDPPAIVQPACKDCRFFHNLQPQEFDVRNKAATDEGLCCRRAPTTGGRFPVIQFTDWCGEFSPRETR